MLSSSAMMKAPAPITGRHDLAARRRAGLDAGGKIPAVAGADHGRDGDGADRHDVGDRRAGDGAEQRRGDDRDFCRSAERPAGDQGGGAHEDVAGADRHQQRAEDDIDGDDPRADVRHHAEQALRRGVERHHRRVGGDARRLPVAADDVAAEQVERQRDDGHGGQRQADRAPCRLERGKDHERAHAHVEERQVVHDVHEAVGVQRHVQAAVDRDQRQQDVPHRCRAGAAPQRRLPIPGR